MVYRVPFPGFRFGGFSSQFPGVRIREGEMHRGYEAVQGGEVDSISGSVSGVSFWGFRFSVFGGFDTHRGDEAVERVEVDGIVDFVDPV